jgi:hypothetical protein
MKYIVRDALADAAPSVSAELIVMRQALDDLEQAVAQLEIQTAALEADVAAGLEVTHEVERQRKESRALHSKMLFKMRLVEAQIAKLEEAAAEFTPRS